MPEPRKRRVLHIEGAFKWLVMEIDRQQLQRAEVARRTRLSRSTITHALNKHDGGIGTIRKIAAALGYDVVVEITFRRKRKRDA
jgi:transcriptional regulator with XRE-family HTH domain